MNDEMFMKLLDMVSQAGEGGFTLAILYLGQNYFSQIVVTTMIIFIVIRVARIVETTLRSYKTLREIANIVGFEWYGELSRMESKRIVELVRRKLS